MKTKIHIDKNQVYSTVIYGHMMSSVVIIGLHNCNMKWYTQLNGY